MSPTVPPVFCCSLCAYSHTEIEMLCVVLTQRCQVSVLGAEQEEIHSDLLARAVQCQFLVEVCGRAEVLNSLKIMKNNEKQASFECAALMFQIKD